MDAFNSSKLLISLATSVSICNYIKRTIVAIMINSLLSMLLHIISGSLSLLKGS